MQQKMELKPGSIIYLPCSSFPQRNFQIISLLGKGGQGDVYLAQPQGWGNFQQNVALKVSYEMKDVERQFIQNLIQYQNQEDKLPVNQRSQMIKIYDIVEYQGFWILIMERGEESLYDYIQNVKGRLKIIEKIKILKQMSQAIWFLHFNNRIHRDIKPENFVKVGEEFKLIDFGLVKQIEFINTINVGSPLFQAPEVRNGQQNYSKGVDIWSLGVTFYEILTEDQFQQTNFQNISIKSSEQISFNVQQKFRELLQNMMQTEPQKRITIQQVIDCLTQLELSSQPMNLPPPQYKQNMMQLQQSANKEQQSFSKSLEPSSRQSSIKFVNPQLQQNLQQFQINNQPTQKVNPPMQKNSFMTIQNQNVSQNPNNQNNYNQKFETEQQFEKFSIQQQQVLQQYFTSFQEKFQNLFEYEIQNIKLEQQIQYQDMKYLIKEQMKQIETQHQKNIIQIGSQVNNELIESKLSELNQQIINSQKEQKEIQYNLKKILDFNNESKVQSQNQQELQFKNLFQQLDQLKRQQEQQNQKGQPQLAQDNISQQLNQIFQEQQEMKKILQFQYQINLQQKNNFVIPNQNIDINQIQMGLTKIEKEMKKSNEEVKQQILQQLEQIQEENAQLARNMQNNDKYKINENQNQNEIIKEIYEAIQDQNKSLSQMNQVSLKEINQQLSNSLREKKIIQQNLKSLLEQNEFSKTNNYLVYFQDIQQKLKELKQQLAEENKDSKAFGQINAELKKLNSLVQNQCIDKLIKNNIKYGEIERGIQEILQKFAQNTPKDNKAEGCKICQPNQGDYLKKYQSPEKPYNLGFTGFTAINKFQQQNIFNEPQQQQRLEIKQIYNQNNQDNFNEKKQVTQLQQQDEKKYSQLQNQEQNSEQKCQLQKDLNEPKRN